MTLQADLGGLCALHLWREVDLCQRPALAAGL